MTPLARDEAIVRDFFGDCDCRVVGSVEREQHQRDEDEANAALARIVGQARAAEQLSADWRSEAVLQQDLRLDAKARADRLAETLRFYANEENYLWHGDRRGAIQKDDRGATARAALAGAGVTDSEEEA